MNKSMIYEMKGNIFPFGVLNDSKVHNRKILIKKRLKCMSQSEYTKLKEQIEKLKQISHKNTINLRSA